MDLTAISILYMDPAIILQTITQMWATAGFACNPSPWMLVDNRWPLSTEPEWIAAVSNFKSALACANPILERPERNRGGHGGFNFGLEKLKALTSFTAETLVLNYDLDIWPLTPGWGKAMVDVMRADPSLGYVALLDERCVNNRRWRFETIAGHRCAVTDSTDMWAATLFRGRALDKGMLAPTLYYGKVEIAMEAHMREIGMRWCYLYDFRETKHPVPHHPIYSQYKREHADGRYFGSFEEYVRDKMPLSGAV